MRGFHIKKASPNSDPSTGVGGPEVGKVTAMNTQRAKLFVGCVLAFALTAVCANAKTVHCDESLGDRCEYAAVMPQNASPAPAQEEVGFKPSYDATPYLGPMSDHCARYTHLCVFRGGKK